MKKLFFVLAALLAGMTCLAATSPAHEDENKAVEKAIVDKNVTIEINTIIPSIGPMKQTSDGYTLKVSEGKVDAYLPYFGESHSAIIPGLDEPGIKFDDIEVNISVNKKKAKKGEYGWKFTAKSGSEEVQVFMTLWTSGDVEIRCQPANRSSISYRGTIVTESL